MKKVNVTIGIGNRKFSVDYWRERFVDDDNVYHKMSFGNIETSALKQNECAELMIKELMKKYNL